MGYLEQFIKEYTKAFNDLTDAICDVVNDTARKLNSIKDNALLEEEKDNI